MHIFTRTAGQIKSGWVVQAASSQSTLSWKYFILNLGQVAAAESKLGVIVSKVTASTLEPKQNLPDAIPYETKQLNPTSLLNYTTNFAVNYFQFATEIVAGLPSWHFSWAHLSSCNFARCSLWIELFILGVHALQAAGGQRNTVLVRLSQLQNCATFTAALREILPSWKQHALQISKNSDQICTKQPFLNSIWGSNSPRYFHIVVFCWGFIYKHEWADDIDPIASLKDMIWRASLIWGIGSLRMFRYYYVLIHY